MTVLLIMVSTRVYSDSKILVFLKCTTNKLINIYSNKLYDVVQCCFKESAACGNPILSAVSNQGQAASFSP